MAKFLVHKKKEVFLKNIPYYYLKFTTIKIVDELESTTSIYLLKTPVGAIKGENILKKTPFYYNKNNLKVVINVERITFKEGEEIKSKKINVNNFNWMIGSIVSSCNIK